MTFGNNMELVGKPGVSNPSTLGRRHVVAFMGFLSCFLINIQRMSLGVSIVAMVNQTATDHVIDLNSTIIVCPSINSTLSSLKQKVEGEFTWSSQEQGYVLGAGFLGFCLATIPASKLSKMIQARRVALYSSILTSITTLVAPVCATWHVNMMIAVLLIRGVGQVGIRFVVAACSCLCLISWLSGSLVKKGALLSTFVISGYSLGSTVASAVTGCICDMPSLGWSGVFYIFGGFGFLHAVLTIYLLYESPKDHPRISSAELIYLSDNEGCASNSNTPRTPWLQIFTSVPFYALLVGILGQYWTFSYFWTVHSTFLGTIQHFPITENDYWSCLPFLMKAFGEYTSSSIANWLLMKNYVTVDVLRRTCNTIGCIGFSAAVFGTYLSGCNGSISAITAAVSMFFTGVATPGAMICCIDMAPRFAGSLSGLLNGAGGSTSFIVPIIVGILTKNKTLEEWHLVFFISIAVVMFSCVVFAIFGSAKVQPWNFVEEEKDQKSIAMNEYEKKEIPPQISTIVSNGQTPPNFHNHR
ncbi:probable small intestine urate exporter [Caerostris darwini]|uniref:Probable small intestine urate exporter n=1 Tax=Caerostris darwini TaxID=1538125 RepID=A0AAV4W9K6_9ARAC|nr:probable small intestine urate exporter [Caerostris darwini]